MSTRHNRVVFLLSFKISSTLGGPSNFPALWVCRNFSCTFGAPSKCKNFNLAKCRSTLGALRTLVKCRNYSCTLGALRTLVKCRNYSCTLGALRTLAKCRNYSCTLGALRTLAKCRNYSYTLGAPSKCSNFSCILGSPSKCKNFGQV